MNRSGAPADCWLLCMIHASYVLNHLSCEALGGNVPLGMLYGVSPDISILLLYTFYQPVFYATHNQSYPSSSEERAARWVGVGDALTHKLLDDDTKKILCRSAFRPSDLDWKGSKYNVQVEWETGEITFEPLSIIAVDDPVTCAAYAKESDLLALEGWHRFRSLAKKDIVLARAIKQRRSGKSGDPKHTCLVILRNYMEAMQFDSENKNSRSKWYDAIKLEVESMLEYKVFIKWDKAILDKHKKVTNPPKDNHRIKVHLVFAVKFDGR